MHSAFSIKTGRWDIAWPGRISKHDIVCHSPPLDPMQGLPLGNGDLGALVWCEPGKLCLAVNKCDLWDDSPDELDGYHNDPDGHHTEEQTALRHGCRMEIDLGMPFLDSWYLQDFEARLDLARGMALIRATTPFGTLSARVFVSAAARTLMIACEVESNESFAPRIMAERWGSRTSQMWYSIQDRRPTWGLGGTSTEVVGRQLLIRQQLRKLDFTVATVAADNGAPLTPAVMHSRGGRFETSPTARHSLRLKLAIANSEESGASRQVARVILAQASDLGDDQVEADHVAAWRQFWERTCLRTHDDLIDNLWHLAIYYAASSQRGRYPGLFTQALWHWNRDFQPWTYYFHWNQQQLTWPLPASGHPELMRPYLDLRFAQLPLAIAMARRHGKPGAYYGDRSDRAGHTGYYLNRTPGGQIAADFYRAYRYDGDTAYLREKGWPVIREVARWHMGMLEKREDGLFHTTPGTGYEGGNMLRDCTSELVTIRRVLEIAGECARRFGHDALETAQWQDALANLAPLVTMESPINTGVTIIAAGYQKGIEKEAGKVLCGTFKEGDAEEWANPKPTCAHDPKRWGGIFSDVGISPVFPDGRIGLGDKGTGLFDFAVATVREEADWLKQIVQARLGLAKELWDELARLCGIKWTCMGFGIDTPNKEFWETALVADVALNPKDLGTKDYKTHPDWEAFKQSRIPVRMWEFRAIGMERLNLLATAVAEALLQSHDGVIRVGCALPEGASFAFTLMAAGGFWVSAEGVGVKPGWIHIDSSRGGCCTVANPWGSTVFLLNLSTGEARELEGVTVAFDTASGARYLLAPERLAVGDWECMPQTEKPNTGPKSRNTTFILGIPRMF